MILLMRITDPAFKFEEIQINNSIIKNINKNDSYENLFNSFKLKINEITKIKVISDSWNIDYAKSILVYSVNKLYEDDFNLSVELDRWFSLKN